MIRIGGQLLPFYERVAVPRRERSATRFVFNCKSFNKHCLLKGIKPKCLNIT